MRRVEIEITAREKEMVCRLIQKIKLATLCDLLAEAYPADKPSDTKSKVTEMANLMLKLKSAGYGTKDRPKTGSKEKLESMSTLVSGE